MGEQILADHNDLTPDEHLGSGTSFRSIFMCIGLLLAGYGIVKYAEAQIITEYVSAYDSESNQVPKRGDICMTTRFGEGVKSDEIMRVKVIGILETSTGDDNQLKLAIIAPIDDGGNIVGPRDVRRLDTLFLPEKK